MISSRLGAGLYLSQQESDKKVAIYGAGSAGIQLASALRVSQEMEPIVFVDNNRSLQGTYLGGIKVLHPDKLKKLAQRGKIDEVLIAMPSASKSTLRSLLKQIEDYSLRVRILPGLAELAQGKISVSELKEVDITDLLGRYEVEAKHNLINENIKFFNLHHEFVNIPQKKNLKEFEKIMAHSYNVMPSLTSLAFAIVCKKIKSNSSNGLKARTRIILQIFFALMISILVINNLDDHINTTISFPFFKNLIVNFGYFYLFISLFIIVGSANAVNLTDGLDGLAIVPVMIVAMTFAFIAYVSGNIVFSEYLLINYIPGTGELSVLCGALIGAALGFLWFNAPPAKVFMGDTGSLALGASIGSIAIMVKHEIVLAIAGGLFVLETLSVIIQVISYKLTGKRVFMMAPLHHHFEKKGWAESTIVIRFWIITIVLALLSLATLKIR